MGGGSYSREEYERIRREEMNARKKEAWAIIGIAVLIFAAAIAATIFLVNGGYIGSR